MSASNSSNQRFAAPHVRQNATQSPRTFRRSSRSQSLALPMLATVLLVAGCGHGHTSTRGGSIERFTIHSAFVHRDLHEILVVPPRPRGKPWLLVLLHGATGSPDDFLSQQFFDGLEKLGPRAPHVLLLDDDGDSYWHDRRTGPWGMEVLLEAIPAGIARTGARRIALGGISMGGYGALNLGVGGTFCAVGGHSPALWPRAADTAPGAFDDAADFARNDIVNHPPSYGKTPVWIDVGASDGFRATDVRYAHEIHAQLHVWPGGHEGAYWRAHIARYLRFYARYCS
jgi:poly(3-hydroxybutyrate) depolymerase